MANDMRFKRHKLPVGDEQIPVLVASEGEQPKAVFMSYESFLDLAATLYTAIEALKTAGVDPSMLSEEEDEDDVAEFQRWDAGFGGTDAASDDIDEDGDYPRLRLVVGG